MIDNENTGEKFIEQSGNIEFDKAPNTESESMEVQKHPHHVMHKKKWSEYVLEFFMLFLAVFLGFVAENIREHSVERHREIEYIQSIKNDLKTDTTKLGIIIKGYNENLKRQDSIKKMFLQMDKGFNLAIDRNMDGLRGFPDFIYTDGTIQQLKNSGGFRLIQHQKAVDSIMAYDAEVKKSLINEAGLSAVLHKMHEYEYEFFNYLDLDISLANGNTPEQLEQSRFNNLFSHDKNVLARYYNKIRFYRLDTELVKSNMENLKIKATRLINFLEKEYSAQ
ncbi:MAG TPA: hypothetical protein VM101_01235 [Flavitalea sp.]|nr:hypothetical protein [Flavitalea sp.]